VQLHALNEAHGHLNGDAVLVEEAAALTAKAQNGEIVARVGGNTFAIFFPAAPSRAWLVDTLARYGEAFSVEMGIGDRDGLRSLPVSARIGFARAPADGATFDALLLSAEGRARAASTHPDRRIYPAS
jgi:diguanylate cyclase (GGDEF)-like protein